jgi:hypothetical protein
MPSTTAPGADLGALSGALADIGFIAARNRLQAALAALTDPALHPAAISAVATAARPVHRPAQPAPP